MPNPITQLPADYTEIASLDLKRDFHLIVQMQIWGSLAFVLFLFLFWFAMLSMRPQAVAEFEIFQRLPEGGLRLTIQPSLLIGMLASVVLMLIFHEAVHGFFFWLFTGRRPTFGFKIYYAYAASPQGTYLTRGQYWVAGLSPLVLLSAAGLLLFPVVPAWGLPLLYFFLVGNASGAIGDMWVALWMLRQPPSTLYEDRGDSVSAFAPAASLE
jgi:hypothetical protein